VSAERAAPTPTKIANTISAFPVWQADTDAKGKDQHVADRTEPTRPVAVRSRSGSPFQLNLEQQRKRAKELVRDARAGDANALTRFRRHHPDGRAISGARIPDHLAHLTEAQLVIARELGLPSWPRLKAHISAMQQAQHSISSAAAAPDGEVPTLHIRCGSDLGPTLKDAGFCGAFLEYSDPLCQGPVVKDAAWLTRRAAFLARAYQMPGGDGAEQIARDLERVEGLLRSAARTYERVVLWFEHDSYDQLVLTRCLAQFADTPVRRLELISVDGFPGTTRFIGLGQLPPEALRLLWHERRPLSEHEVRAGQAVWEMLRSPDPTLLAAAAVTPTPGLPHLSRAIRRHCQELPWVNDGLSLTERMVLQLLAEGQKAIGEVYRDLMVAREPLPWLGDLMFLFVVESMKRVSQPVFTAAPGRTQRWPSERLTITDMGRAVLAGVVDWLSLSPPERWLGGVHIAAYSRCWRWDERNRTTILR
jgi:hypothetical protein